MLRKVLSIQLDNFDREFESEQSIANASRECQKHRLNTKTADFTLLLGQ